MNLQTPAHSGSQRRAVLAMLAMTAGWGSSFPLSRYLLRQMSAQDYLALRFGFAAAVAALVCHRQLAELSRRLLVKNLFMGLIYAAAQLCVVIGLRSTPAGESAFITSLAVITTPALGWLLMRTPPPQRLALGAVLACSGVAVMSIDSTGIGVGQIVTLGAALGFGLHMVLAGRWTRPEDVIGATSAQLIGCAAVLLMCDLGHTPHTPHDAVGWLVLAYLSLIVAGVAMFAQLWVQSRLSADRVALLASTEPVWAAGIAVVVLGEDITIRTTLGAVLVLAGIGMVELLPGLRAPGRSGSEGEPSGVWMQPAKDAHAMEPGGR